MWLKLSLALALSVPVFWLLWNLVAVTRYGILLADRLPYNSKLQLRLRWFIENSHGVTINLGRFGGPLVWTDSPKTTTVDIRYNWSNIQRALTSPKLSERAAKRMWLHVLSRYDYAVNGVASRVASKASTSAHVLHILAFTACDIKNFQIQFNTTGITYNLEDTAGISWHNLDDKTKLEIVCHRNISLETLMMLWEIATCPIKRRHNYPAGQNQQLTIKEDIDKAVLAAILARGSLPSVCYRRTAEHKHDLTRLTVATCHNTPCDVLTMLALDSDPEVAAAASRALSSQSSRNS